MRFIDETRIFVKSGDGGRGCVSFRREKFVPRGGPDGGNGGRGGHVTIVADSQSMGLHDLHQRKHFRAKRGAAGGSSNRQGKIGQDILVSVPPGTMIYNEDKTELLADLDHHEASFLAVRGGQGGRGNAGFATSRQRSPRTADDGEVGQERWLALELKLIADVGLLGFPSSGKSTLVAAVSQARPKIAAYPFTTLLPNLGVVDREEGRRFMVADLPGLIEGAHRGVGLGLKFLRHVERTRVLVHLLDLDPQNGRDPVRDFETINRELRLYGRGVADKPRIVVANKIDLPGAEERWKKVEEALRGLGVDASAISAKDGRGVEEFLDALDRILAEIPSASGTNRKEPD